MHFLMKTTSQGLVGVFFALQFLTFVVFFLSQILMTAKATPVETVALVSMVSTPTSVSVAMVGREPTVKPVSLKFFGTLGWGRPL